MLARVQGSSGNLTSSTDRILQQEYELPEHDSGIRGNLQYKGFGKFDLIRLPVWSSKCDGLILPDSRLLHMY